MTDFLKPKYTVNALTIPYSDITNAPAGTITFLGAPTSANLAALVTDETGSGALVFATSPTLVTPALGTPSALVGTNITGTAAGFTAGAASAVAVGGITGLGTGVATALAIAVGSAGAPVTFNGALGTPSSGTGTNITGVNAATLGGATFAAPGAIGSGTPGTIAGTTGDFSGAIAIGNTVAAAAAVVSTHKVTISIGGSTYYLLASNV